MNRLRVSFFLSHGWTENLPFGGGELFGEVDDVHHQPLHKLQITIPRVFLHERRGSEVVQDTFLFDNG